MPQWIHLGTLLRPHGIKGEICIEWYADSPSLLDAPLSLQVGQRPPYPVRVMPKRSELTAFFQAGSVVVSAAKAHPG